MKRACLYVNSHFVKNGIFSTDLPLNRDNQLEPFRLLKRAFAQRGYDLATQDLHPVDQSDLVLYIDRPKALPKASDRHKSFLLMIESQLIRPDNWSRRMHRRFAGVFTWSGELLREKATAATPYIQIQVPQPPTPPRPHVPFAQRKLCCLVSGGKLSLHPLELYSARIKWVRWFERYRPEDFEFYGAGWKKLWMTGPLYIRAINKLPFWRGFIKPFPSYRGPAHDKIATIANFKFAICFENARDIEGYITEKIFDCFFAGTIPIYRGAPEITQKVPADCFIDLRNFSGQDEVVKFISAMDAETFDAYQTRMAAYLESDLYKNFSAERFVQTIADHMIKA